jgi:DNA-binding GntR family transcriptional regulator
VGRRPAGHDLRSAGEVEHTAILEALIAGDERGAVMAMAHHLAGAALRLTGAS